ncbi:GGDEF domain-containing protein [Pleionea mediterranea]|uniref:diguanylate cyclase n=1 Tax=Pleionea mediterranea TaxID=523701 RepID=A0A316FD30_9GAMM|nr:diguanylate cyclase [Pleionea mediterranea]PWK46323.1 diguanylate cyclase [Pleionea mediterranea]
MVKDPTDQHIKTIGRLSLQSLTWLRDRQIPAEPVAYSVSYEYNHSVMHELVEFIDAFEAEQKSLDDDSLDQIFREFILVKYIDVDGFNKTVSDIVDDTGAAVTEARNQLREFRQFLKQAREQLKQLKESNTRELVHSLITNTEATFQSVQALESHLHTVKAEMRTLQKKYTIMQREARQDQLTGLLNRNALQSEFDKLIKDSDKQPITLVVADIDLFKNFNDQHGHTIGDKVIKLVADTLQSNLKGSDIVSRYGGEEYVIVLPNTQLSDCAALMNRIRETIARLYFVNKSNNERIDCITMSFGIAGYQAGDNFHSLFDRADKALYQSKQNGRNQVNIAD